LAKDELAAGGGDALAVRVVEWHRVVVPLDTADRLDRGFEDAEFLLGESGEFVFELVIDDFWSSG
jgi:hypothetical protein